MTLWWKTAAVLPDPEGEPSTPSGSDCSCDLESDQATPKNCESDEGGGLEVGLSRKFLAAGLSLTWQNVTFTVHSNKNRREQKLLLRGVSGFCRPAELTALMGSSGAGKSSLIDVLAGRQGSGHVSGDIRFGGAAPSVPFHRRYTAYCEQHDTLIDNLTPEEMLHMTADLKRPLGETQEQRRELVDELLTRLALVCCRGVPIGSSLARGISGGQRKRVNIGLALVGCPRVLFLDEPISGLDSFAATEVMAVVAGLAKKGMTVFCSIHSPAPRVFNLFDRLLMLGKGWVIYFGPAGMGPVTYFSQLCPDRPGLGPGENAADWIVDLTCKAEWRGDEDTFAASYAGSDLKHMADAQIQLLLGRSNRDLSEKDHHDLSVTAATATPIWWGLRTLFKYRAVKNYRSASFLIPRIGDKILFGAVLSSLYWGKGSDLSAENVTNLTFLTFSAVSTAAMCAITYTPTLVQERPLFARERGDGLYKVITYLLFKMLEELIIAVFSSVLLCQAMWWALALQGSWVLYWLVFLGTMLNGIALAYFFAAVSPTMDIAVGALPLFVALLLFFAGLLLRYDSIPVYWKWLANANFLRYGWGSLMMNQFGGDRNVPVFGGVTVLDYFSLAHVDKWAWLGIEVSFSAAFFLAAYLGLRFVNHARQ